MIYLLIPTFLIISFLTYHYLQGNLEKYYKVHIYQYNKSFYIRKFGFGGWWYMDTQDGFWYTHRSMYAKFNSLEEAKEALRKGVKSVHFLN